MISSIDCCDLDVQENYIQKLTTQKFRSLALENMILPLDVGISFLLSPSPDAQESHGADSQTERADFHNP